MVLKTQVLQPMYPDIPRTRHEYERIHGVDRHDAWIEKYQSDLYLEDYYARGDDFLDFASELYPEYVLVILKRRHIFPTYEEQLVSEPHTPNARATLSMRVGVSHRSYMSFTSRHSSISPELLLAEHETDSGWVFDEVRAPRWVTMPEFCDETYLLELPRTKVYSLMTVAARQPANAIKKGLAEEIDAYLDLLQKEHPDDDSARYPPRRPVVVRYTVPFFPRPRRVLPPSWNTKGEAVVTQTAPVAPPALPRPHSLPPSYRMPVSHGMATRSYGELYKLRLRNRSISRMKYESLP